MAALYRDALEAIRDALYLPYAPTDGWDEARQRVLDKRLAQAVSTLSFVLESDKPDSIAWHIAYLRERLTELPTDGYVTGREADEALAHGATWMEAVAELREREICGPGCCGIALGVHTSCPGPLVGRTVVSVR